MPKPFAALAAALLSIPLAACGTAPPGPAPVSRFAASQAPVPEYRIQIGDALGIKFFLNPELNEEIVVRPDGRHWQLRNLSVHDGSVFPTSIGANPQLSIYGIVNRLAQGLARELTGTAPASLA